MSDCCSCCWAGLTGCHSHWDAMPQPKHGGGCLPVQELWDEGRGGEVRVGSVCQPSARNSGWIESLGILLCTNREYIFFFSLPLSSVRQKSKAGNPTITSVASLCWQRCNMSDINVRRSRCEGAQRQSDLVFTPSRAPSLALAGHGRYTKGVTQPRLLDSQKPV